jgi:hypothetical protein
MVAVRKHLSSLTGLEAFPNREPSHKWLGYFHRPPLQPKMPPRFPINRPPATFSPTGEKDGMRGRTGQRFRSYGARLADDETTSSAPERFAFQQAANVTQVFGQDAQAIGEISMQSTGLIVKNPQFSVRWIFENCLLAVKNRPVKFIHC